MADDQFTNPSFVRSTDQFLQEESREQSQRATSLASVTTSSSSANKIDRFAQRLAHIRAKVASRDQQQQQPQHQHQEVALQPLQNKNKNQFQHQQQYNGFHSPLPATVTEPAFVPAFTFASIVSPLAPAPAAKDDWSSTASRDFYSASRTQQMDATEPQKLPLLSRLPPHGNQPSVAAQENLLDKSQLEKRFCQQQLFATKAEQNALEEQKASVLLEEASRAADQVRIATAIYIQNEKNWNFDERAKKTQELADLKSEAEQASRTAQQQVARLAILEQELTRHDPYLEYRPPPTWNFALEPLPKPTPTTVALRNATSSVEASEKPAMVVYSARRAPLVDDEVVMWLLASATNASPTTEIGGVSLTRGVQKQFSQEKQVSQMLVYYVANATSQLDGPSDCYDDKPPESGWRSCSHYGTAPPPVLKYGRGTSLDTILIQGAGAAVVNGRYILNGKHNNVNQFKSVAGIELFRKAIPRNSAIDLGLNEIPPVTTTNEGGVTDIMVKPTSRGGARNKTEEIRLPRVLETVAKNESDFNVMRRIGAWMGHHPPREDKNLDSNHREEAQVTIQATHNETTTKDLCISTAKHAPVCSEWVLFLKCQQHQKGYCTRRHYYTSHEEKLTKMKWAYHQESDLEKNVLGAIILREHCIDTIQTLGNKLMQEFQENLPIKTTLRLLLREMNVVRYLSVRVLEVIEEWRKFASSMGFARLQEESAMTTDQQQQQQARLEWSCSITLNTGKLLYKGSNAFESRVKRFCRDKDTTGKKEIQVIYLGCYASKMEAEKAYDDAAMIEARKLNIPFAAMPLKRLVLKSCGKHFAIESDHLGPSYCIECQSAMQRTMTAEDWTPPFNYRRGENYILKMASDLDFLNDLLPLHQVLNNQSTSSSNASSSMDREEAFPLLGNAFLLPKTPLQDPELAFFTTLTIPLLQLNSGNPVDLDSRLVEEFQHPEVDDKEDQDEEEFRVLGRDRLLRAQHVLLRELEIYKTEKDSIKDDDDEVNETADNPPKQKAAAKEFKSRKMTTTAPLSPRIVEALYWDRCAALSIKQKREPLAFRQRDVWCRPDVGEWQSLVPRGKNILHYIFEAKLKESGEQLLKKRQQVLTLLRDLLKKPFYRIHDRRIITQLISEAMEVKGDVVFLTLKSVNKYLDLYDLTCVKTRIVQRWYRGAVGRIRAKAHQRLLQVAYQLRRTFLTAVSVVAQQFYHQQMIIALHRATHAVCTPFFSQAITEDHEKVIVSVHLVRFDPEEKHLCSSSFAEKRTHKPLRFRTPWLCIGCARRFVLTSRFEAQSGSFRAINCNVCTCNRFVAYHRRDEKWLIRAYNPSTNLVYRLQLNSALVLQLIAVQNPRRTGNLSSHVSRDEHGESLIQPGAQTLKLLEDDASLSKWNPISNAEEWHQFATEMSLIAQFYHRQARECFLELQNWRQLSADAMRRRKNASITLDKAKSNLASVRSNYATAEVLASKAMKFASKPFESAQAWDSLENANDWQLLTKKRRLELQVMELEEFVQCSQFRLFQAIMDENFSRVMAQTWQERYNLLQQQELTSQQKSEQVDAKASFWQLLALQSVQRVCRELVTIRDTFLAPTRRQLTLKCSVWQRFLRCSIPGMWRGRSCLCRRVVKVSNGVLSVVHKVIQLVVEASVESSDWNAFYVSGYDPNKSVSYEVYVEWPILEMILRDRRRHDPRPRFHNVNKLVPGMANRQEMCDRAACLVSRAILDPYTDAFSLRKLHFFQILRRVGLLICTSLWYHDAVRGRKGGVGDEIARQTMVIDGILFYATVFENWGDLVWIIYRPRTTETYQIQLQLRQIIDCLHSKPFQLQLWIASVMSNNYPTAMLKYLAQFFRLVPLADDATNRPVDSSARIKPPTHQLIFARDATRVYRRKYQRVVRIDDTNVSRKRLVLVSISENSNCDLLIKAFDWHQNFTYVLELERESIRRIFNVPADADATHCNLLVHGNQHKLYDAICFRLTFQSVFHDYYDFDQSLGFGSRVRQSLEAFNDWIARGRRNPLQPVDNTDIDEFAAQVDANAFSTLLFDRLTLLHTTFCSTKHHLVRTGDIHVDQFSFDFGLDKHKLLKLDIFKSRHDYALRLREEIASEFERRNELANYQQMQQEETRCFVSEIDQTMMLFRRETDFWLLFLTEMRHFLEEKQRQRHVFHQELLQYTRERNEAVSMNTNDQEEEVVEESLQDHDRTKEVDDDDNGEEDLLDVDLKLYELLQMHRDLRDFFHPVRSSISEFSLFRFFTLEWVFEMVHCYFLDVVRALVDLFVKRIEEDIVQDVDLAEVERAQLPLEPGQMHMFWKDLSFYFEHFEPITSLPEGEVTALQQQHVVITNQQSCCSNTHDQNITDIPPGLSTFVIPADPMMPMEEVYLASLDRHALLLIFQSCSGSDPHPDLLLKATKLGGILVLTAASRPGTNKVVWNPRASALAGQAVVGVAIYCCSKSLLNQPELQETSLVTRITKANNKYQLLLVQQEDKAEDFFTQQQAKRSTTLLPWKAFATRRLMVARQMRRNTFHVLLQHEFAAQKRDFQQQEEQLKDEATLAVGHLSHREAECMFGENILTGDDGTLTNELASSIQVITSSDHVVGRRVTYSLGMQRPRTLFCLPQQINAVNELSEAQAGAEPEVTGDVEVQVDDILVPTRLVFCCHELKTKQQFFVDLDRHQARVLLGINPQTIAQWRDFAKEAITHLALERRNGATELIYKSPATTQVTSASMDVTVQHDMTMYCQKSVRRLAQEAQVLVACGRHRLLKHALSNLMSFVRLYVARESSRIKSQFVHEWMAMASEDSKLLQKVPAPPLKTFPPEIETVCEDPVAHHEGNEPEKEQQQEPQRQETLQPLKK